VKTDNRRAGHGQPNWETNELPHWETNELETFGQPDTTTLKKPGTSQEILENPNSSVLAIMVIIFMHFLATKKLR
jgi:hypothetical protein